MKFKTVDLKTANVEHIILPRSNFTLVFEVAPVESFDAYRELLQHKTVTMYTVGVGETKEIREEDSGYWLDWLVVCALRQYYILAPNSKDESEIKEQGPLQWDDIDLQKIETYPKWREELKEAGLSENELARIVQQVMTVNGMNPMAVARAREDFFRLKGAAGNGS